MLAKLKVRANLVLPIIQDSHLWGLLIVHECFQPRHWYTSDVNLLKQIADQVAIALQQAAAYEQVQTELEERRRTEQALRESEAQLRLAFEAARMGSWNWNIQKGEIKWSANMEALFGLAPGEFDGSYEMFVSRLHPEDRDRVLKAIEMAVATGANYNIEFRVVYPNGTIRWALSKGKVFYDQNGQPIQMAGIDLDISDRKLFETKLYQLNQKLEQRVAERTADLQQSEARLQEAQKIARMGNWEFDVITEKITWSPEVFLIFGFDLESTEPNYQDLNQYIHPESREYHEFLVQRAITQAEPYETDLKILRQDGTSGYLFAKAQVVRNEKNQVVRLFGIVMDITERKQAEAELQKVSNRLQLAIKASHSGIWEINLFEGDVYWNEGMYQLFGITPSDRLNLQQIWENSLHPDDRTRMLQDLTENLQNNQEIFAEYRIVRPDGEIRFIEASAVIQRDEQGKPRRVIGINYDITERKQTELENYQLKERLQYLLSSSPVIIYAYEPNDEHQVTFISQNIQTILGYTPEEVLASSNFCHSHIHPEDLPQVRTNIAKLLKSGHLIYEYRFLDQNGNYRWMQNEAKVILNQEGKPIEIIGSFSDITERKQTEAALEQYTREVEDLYDNAPCGYHSLDAEGRLLRVNQTELQLLGYTREEMIGKRIWEFFTAASQKNFSKNFSRFQQQGWVKELEYEMICKDGSVLPVLISAIAVKDEHGKLLYNRATLIDIKDRKQAELALQASEAKLQGIIQSAPGSITTFDRQGTITYLNRTTEGFSLEQVIGRNISEFLLPQYHNLQTEGLEQIFEQGKTVQCEVEGYLDSSGNTAWYRVQSSPIWDGDQVVMGISNAIDISDLKRAETALRESENRYATLTETAPVAIFRFDAGGKCIYVNDSWTKMTGRSKEQALGDGWIEALHPEDRDRLLTEWSQKMGQQQLYCSEGRHLCPDGSIVWFFCQVLPEINLDGNIVGYIGTLTDISALKQTEAALRASERRYSTLAENIPVALFRFNSEGDCIYVNERWQIMTGRPTQSALGRGWIEAIHPEDRDLGFAEALRDRLQQEKEKKLTQQKKFQSEGRHLLPDGTIRWFLCQTLPEIDSDGKQIGFFGTLTDITERKKAEHIIHQQAQRELSLRLITQRIRQSLDLNTIFTTAVQEIRQLFKTERVVIYRFNFDWSGSFVAESMAEGWTPLVGTLPKIKDTHLQETQGGRYAQNETFAVDDIYQVGHSKCHLELLEQFEVKAYVIAPIFLGDRLWGLLAAYQNSSPRHWEKDEISLLRQIGWQLSVALQQADLFKQLQKELAERKEAEAKLQEMNQQLELSNRQLERATSLKDEFLANMSHEFRTPLNTILGMSEALQEEVFGTLNEEQQKTIVTIESSGRHLLELINDILDVAKIEAGKLELNVAPTCVQELCQSSLLFIQQQALKKRIQLHTNITSDLGVIQVDQRRMRQVLINLLNNAVKFTPSGGAITLEVQVESVTQLICFSVIDTGIGIASENLNQLFQPFIQIDSALNRQYSGTGLGLSLVKQITELHGGYITVSSEVGCGSCFKVCLPYTLQPSETRFPQPISTSHPTQQLSSESILIVEDSQIASTQLLRYLTALGIEALVHCQGEGTVEKALELKPTTIILDLVLPNQSGWETLTQLKAHPQTKHIPVIVVSVIDERAQGLQLGAAECLVKPVTKEQLQAVLAKINGIETTPNPAFIKIPEPKRQRPLILLAEDDQANVATFSDYLDSRGYQIILATNAPEAIELAFAQNPELMIIDIQLSMIDGLETIRRLRTIPQFRYTPIIALTTLAIDQARENCLAAGATEYLIKPVRLKQLVTTIEQLLHS